MSVGNLEVSLLYVSATSPDGLVQACFTNNLKLGKQFNYHSVTYSNGKWYAWFSDNVQWVKMLDKPKQNKKATK